MHGLKRSWNRQHALNCKTILVRYPSEKPSKSRIRLLTRNLIVSQYCLTLTLRCQQFLLPRDSYVCDCLYYNGKSSPYWDDRLHVVRRTTVSQLWRAMKYVTLIAWHTRLFKRIALVYGIDCQSNLVLEWRVLISCSSDSHWGKGEDWGEKRKNYS